MLNNQTFIQQQQLQQQLKLLNQLPAAYPSAAGSSHTQAAALAAGLAKGSQANERYGGLPNNEQALMLVNIHDPEARMPLDIMNMKKGHKLRMMAAILETLNDQALIYKAFYLISTLLLTLIY